ncbi:MAG TPA: serine hydrolase domain-containing protein [Terriglobales bacterium]|nr:serine hydrolase domain-containing protein [Terriglobales bacterium]
MNKRWAKILAKLCCLTVAFASNASIAQEAKLALATRKEIEISVAAFMAKNNVPGISVAVVKGGEYVWAAGFGMADLENSVPATSQTLYRLASLSKPITAVAAMQLWQQGKLDLDSPVQKYCPAFPEKAEGQITTRELLNHTAGIRHYRLGPVLDPQVANVKHLKNPIQDGLDFFKDDPLVSKPGAEFHYSTYGYDVIGCVIEGVTGGKYADDVIKSVFIPASMDTAQIDDRFAIIPRRTRFYQKDNKGRVLNSDFLDSSYKIPGGGWLATAEDMAHFEVAMLNDSLVKRSTRDLMWSATLNKLGKGYGFGFGVIKQDDVVTIAHGGDQQGTSTFIGIIPAQKLGVVVLINMEEIDKSTLGLDLLKILQEGSK